MLSVVASSENTRCPSAGHSAFYLKTCTGLMTTLLKISYRCRLMIYIGH